MEGFEFPDDVSHHIIAFLSVQDVCSLAACSQHWHTLCSSDFVWYILFNKRWCFDRKNVLKEQDSLEDNCVLYKKRLCLETVDCSREGKENGNPSSTGWRSEYIQLHKQMSMGAAAVIGYINGRTCHDSMEVADYQKAMNLLSSSCLELQDIEIFLLLPKLSVLINLLGLHYCLTHLKMKTKEAREALHRNKVGERQVCLRWWSLGGWTNGFRRHDEMHMRIASLLTLAELEPPSFLEVIDRGTLHEVLRVQISADFESSAWVARSMHSQR